MDVDGRQARTAADGIDQRRRLGRLLVRRANAFVLLDGLRSARIAQELDAVAPATRLSGREVLETRISWLLLRLIQVFEQSFRDHAQCTTTQVLGGGRLARRQGDGHDQRVVAQAHALASLDDGLQVSEGHEPHSSQYKSGGQTHVESSGSTRQSDADQLVLARVGDVRRGLAVTPKIGRLTLKAGLDGVVTHYKLKELASVESVRGRVANHILKWDKWRAETPMASIDTSKVQAYALHRREEEGAAPATVNRELAILRLAFSLAVKSGLLATKPHVGMLAENNVRKGFFEDAEFHAVVEHVPAELRGMFTLAYFSGWRTKFRDRSVGVAAGRSHG
jgi:hypothetical protein